MSPLLIEAPSDAQLLYIAKLSASPAGNPLSALVAAGNIARAALVGVEPRPSETDS